MTAHWERAKHRAVDWRAAPCHWLSRRSLLASFGAWRTNWQRKSPSWPTSRRVKPKMLKGWPRKLKRWKGRSQIKKEQSRRSVRRIHWVTWEALKDSWKRTLSWIGNCLPCTMTWKERGRASWGACTRVKEAKCTIRTTSTTLHRASETIRRAWRRH